MDDELELEILEAQAEQIECDDDFAAARGGNRAGKSIGFGYWLALKRLQEYPLAVHVAAAKDYENLRRGFLPLMCGLLSSMGWEEGIDFRYVSSGAPSLFLPYLHPRAKLHALSAQLAENLKGTSIQTLLLEEPQAWDTHERSGRRLYEILITRLSHSQTTLKLYPDLRPQLRMSFNPPAVGSWLHTLIEEQWKKSGYKCWRMSVRDNWILLRGDPLYVKRLEDSIDPIRQAAEIDGHWSTGGGGVYYMFNAEVHGRPPEGIPAVDWVDPDQPVLWTHDFNVKLMCSVIAQRWINIAVPSWQPKLLRALDEITVPNAGTPQVVEEFLKSKWLQVALDYQQRTGRPGVELHGDPSGQQTSQTADSRSAAVTNWQILKNGLEAVGVRVKVCHADADPGQKNRVNHTNAQFGVGAEPDVKPGATVNLQKCRVLVQDWREMQWDAQGRKLVKKAGEFGDASDAWAYLCSVERNPKPKLVPTFA